MMNIAPLQADIVLKADNTVLKADIATLKANNAALKTRVDSLAAVEEVKS
jgi:cell division protein FtsB